VVWSEHGLPRTEKAADNKMKSKTSSKPKLLLIKDTVKKRMNLYPDYVKNAYKMTADFKGEGGAKGTIKWSTSM